MHDQIVLCVVAGKEEKAVSALEQAMVQGFLAMFPKREALLQGLAEVKAGRSWAAVK